MSMINNHAGSILYHHRTQGGGVEGVHIQGMVDAFRRLGYTVNIVGPPGVEVYAEVPADRTTAKRKVASLKSFWSRVSNSFPQSFFEFMEICYNLYAYWVLRKCLQRGSYDLLYERYALNTVAGVLLAKAFRLPLILEVNDATVIERSRPLCFKRTAALVERWVFSRADLIVTISERFKKLIMDKHGINADTILVLPNAIDPARFQVGAKTLTREELEIPSDALVLGCVGAFVPWHGLDFLLETVGDRVKRENLFLLFIGDGPVRGAIEQSAERYGIGKRVRFTGFVPSAEVPRYLDLLDIAVIPRSNDHCSPMKLFEYMAMGKPIILPKYQPLLETISHRVEGLFFSPEDAGQFCQCLEYLMADSELRHAMGARARETVMSRYTWDGNVRLVAACLASSGWAQEGIA